MIKIVEKNLWQTSSIETFTSTSLSEDTHVDFLIIGGGFTGCSAALEASKQGIKVCLLEANTIGYGGSGRNVGLVNAGLWTPPDDVEQALGQETGSKLNKALAAGPELVFNLIEEYQIQCEAIRNGTLHCAHSSKGFEDLKNRFTQQKDRNAPVELLQASEARKLVGSNEVYGALLDHRAGTIQPLSYVKGLARAAKALGAVIHENTPVMSLKFMDGYWWGHSAQGRVKAKYLLNATNAYIEGDLGHFQQSFTPVHYFQYATKPLSDDLLGKVLSNKQGCWDTATVMSSFRLDQAGRLIIGSIGSLEDFGKTIHQNWVRRKLDKLFPDAQNIDFDYQWHGRIAMTDDHLPKLISSGQNALTMMGYNGRGISPGTVMGTSIAAYFATGDQSVLPILPVEAYRQGLNTAKATYYEFGASLTHLIKDY